MALRSRKILRSFPCQTTVNNGIIQSSRRSVTQFPSTDRILSFIQTSRSFIDTNGADYHRLDICLRLIIETANTFRHNRKVPSPASSSRNPPDKNSPSATNNGTHVFVRELPPTADRWRWRLVHPAAHRWQHVTDAAQGLHTAQTSARGCCLDDRVTYGWFSCCCCCCCCCCHPVEDFAR